MLKGLKLFHSENQRRQPSRLNFVHDGTYSIQGVGTFILFSSRLLLFLTSKHALGDMMSFDVIRNVWTSPIFGGFSHGHGRSVAMFQNKSGSRWFVSFSANHHRINYPTLTKSKTKTFQNTHRKRLERAHCNLWRNNQLAYTYIVSVRNIVWIYRVQWSPSPQE